MRRFRNPSYAPEFLERKLSPSGIIGIPVSVQVSTPTGTGTDPLPTTGPDGVPPVVPTTNPNNPTGPN